MANFQYRVLRNGQRESGALEAATIEDASAVLRAEGCVIVELAPSQGRKRSPAKDDSPSERSDLELKLSTLLIRKNDVEITMRQLASVLKAGVPILNALHAVRRQAPSLLRRAYSSIIDKVRRSYSLRRWSWSAKP